MSDEELWRAVPGHPQFEVTQSGRIRSVDRAVPWIDPKGVRRVWHGKGAELSPWVARNGYPHVAYQANGKRSKFLVHRMIGMAFVSGHKPGLSINHKNGVKTDNRAENLEWVTLAQNTALQWSTGLVDLRGEKSPNVKLTDDQVRAIRAKRSNGHSVRHLAAEYSVSESLIYYIARGGKRKQA